jgi:hypothetical protein
MGHAIPQTVIFCHWRDLVQLQAQRYACLTDVASAAFTGTAIDTVCHLLWIHSRRMEMHPVSEQYVGFVYF